MAISITTTPTHEQWRILNLLFGEAMNEPRRKASKVLNATNASNGDLLELVDGGLVVGRRGGAPVDLEKDGYSLDSIFLELTSSGRRWVVTNPRNRALRAIGQLGGRRGAQLKEIARSADVGNDTFGALAADRLITIRDVAGQNIPGECLGTGPAGATDTWFARLTRRGSELVDR